MDNYKFYLPLFATDYTYGRPIDDALEVGTQDGNPGHQANRTGYVYKGRAKHIPSDLSFGIREVYWYNNTAIFVKITGLSSANAICEWMAFYNGSTWTNWRKITFQ